MNHSVKVALGILVVLCLYMLSGLIGCGKEEAVEAVVANEAVEKPVMTVQVREMEAVEISREVSVSGKTVPWPVRLS